MSIQVIKFYASWCAPCKLMKPIFNNITNNEEFKDLIFHEIDIENDDNANELVEKFQIKNIPTIVVINSNGNVTRKLIGAVQEQELINFVRESVKNEF